MESVQSTPLDENGNDDIDMIKAIFLWLIVFSFFFFRNLPNITVHELYGPSYLGRCNSGNSLYFVGGF